MSEEQTFGGRFQALSSIAERLELERSQNRRGEFREVDAVLAKLVSAALQGQRVAKVIRPKRRGDPVTVELVAGLSTEELGLLTAHFDIAEQEKRGSWHMPEHDLLSLGTIHLVHWMGRNSRLVLNMADAERAQPFLRPCPEAVAIWAVAPLFDELFLPLKLRGLYWLGNRTVEQQDAVWDLIDPLYEALQIDPQPLNEFRAGTGWAKLTSPEVVLRREALVQAWTRVADDAPERYRVLRIGELIERYYAKAKNGKALRRQVLTKAYARTLTAYFGGDWLAFLRYLGEEAHGQEEIIQALPETKLMTGGSARVSAVADEFGLPADEVHKMLAAYWQTSDATSPVEQRVGALRRFWDEFDELHSRQASGMRSLWGLVEEYAYVHPRLSAEAVAHADAEHTDREDPHRPRLYEQLLSQDLRDDIERLWGTIVLARWPERLVTEAAPYAQMAQAFGPALRFWEGAALTTWFLCEGPYSRTDIDGLANYHATQLQEMLALGAPVSGELFRDLRDAVEKYGAPARVHSNTYTITISLFGDREAESDHEPHVNFERLRDIVTKHRRAWAEQYLDSYLRARWEAAMLGTADRYHRHIAQKGKTPTAKQFSRLAASDANLWSGGDLAGLCGVLGFKAPPAATRGTRLVPQHTDDFATLLYERLRGIPYESAPGWQEDQEERAMWNGFTSLAGLCVSYLQYQEAVGEPPDLKTFGRQKFTYHSSVLAEDPEEAWTIYADAVRDVRVALEQSGSDTAITQPAGSEIDAQSESEPASTLVPESGLPVPGADEATTSEPLAQPEPRRSRGFERLRRRR